MAHRGHVVGCDLGHRRHRINDDLELRGVLGEGVDIEIEPSQLGKVRRDIARVKTILKEKGAQQ